MSNIKDKILSCHGNVTPKSAARMLNISYGKVYQMWTRHDLEVSLRPTSIINLNPVKKPLSINY